MSSIEDSSEVRAIIDDKLAVALSHLPTVTQLFGGMAAVVGIVVTLLVGGVALIDSGAGVAGLFMNDVDQNRRDIAALKNGQDAILEAIVGIERSFDERSDP